jgi:hypothetical protein
MFRLLALLGMALFFCGCGKEAAAPVETEEVLTGDLQRMQGSWCAVSTNQFSLCEVNIDGPTIRLRYQLSADQPVLKRNVSIQYVDEMRKMLVMYNGLGGWTYDLTEVEGVDHLELRFFDEINHDWAVVSLVKSSVPKTKDS